jgi:hypothetical protein
VDPVPPSVTTIQLLEDSMRRLLLLALLALGCVLIAPVTSSPAAAAACAAGPLPANLRDASLVVTGKVTAVEALPNRQVYSVEVQRVYQGSAPKTVTVQGPPVGRPCALAAQVGQSWLLVSQGAATTPAVRVDWGSQLLTADVGAVVASTLGSGKAPSADTAPVPSRVELTRVDDSEPYGYWQMAFPGAVLAAAGLLVLLLARALGGGRPARS